MSIFDSVKKIVVGDVAHDAADSGAPLKIGGKAASQYGVPTAVSGNDRVDALFDVYGRLRVITEAVAATLLLTPATPAPTTPFTSDIRNVSESVIGASDLTIRDNGTHAFVIPMLEKGYRSLTVTYQNGAAIWSHVPTITIYGVIRSGGSPAFLLAAKLAEWAGDLNNNTYHSFGSSDISAVGGLAGITPARTTGLDYYAIPAITDGWSHVAMVWQFASGPTTGEIQRISITRMGF